MQSGIKRQSHGEQSEPTTSLEIKSKRLAVLNEVFGTLNDLPKDQLEIFESSVKRRTPIVKNVTNTRG